MRILMVLIMIFVAVSFILNRPKTTNVTSPVAFIKRSPTPTPTLPPLPSQKILPNDYHVFQTFNNCGPAALSMELSYYGINISQQELGQDLRPYQNPQGDNDDKSVTLDELAEKSKEYGFIPYHRPAGNAELVKKFIANDIPVVARTLTKPTEDIGHYRVIKGYDVQGFIQDDSLQGRNLRFSYDDFNVLWKQFGNEYLVLVPPNKLRIAEAILDGDVNPRVAWQRAASGATGLNLSVALYYLGDYQGSVEAFENVENQLPFRTLWYQIEPIQAYVALGDEARVLSLTQQILDNYNRAFSELYIIRGDIYKKRGDLEAARTEYEKAVHYNVNLQSARDALNSIK